MASTSYISSKDVITSDTLKSQGLREFCKQIEVIESESAELLESLTHVQFNWYPAENRWSIAECMLHLVKAGERYLPAIQAAIKRGRDEGLLGDRGHQPGPLERRLLKAMEPPSRRFLLTSPERLVSHEVGNLTDVSDEFAILQHRIKVLLEDADGLDLMENRVTMPISDWTTLSLGSTFALIAAHERRHLWQARQVREHPDFPSD